MVIGLVVVAGLIVVSFVGLRLYLGSGAARRLAAEQLTARLGGPVRVRSLASGFDSTSVEIELPSSAVPAEPILTGMARVDVSVLGLAAGTSPSTVTVDDAKLTLHFDKDGELRDTLPSPKGGGGALPVIRVNKAAVRIVQEGKPDFHAAGIDLTLTDAGANITIAGAADDPGTGAWTVAGEWAADGVAGVVNLATVRPIRLTPDKLKSIPFVPLETWEAVELDGTSPLKVRVGRRADREWFWHVEFEPTDTRLTIFPVGNLVLTGTSGKVVVDGSKVTLTDVKGTTAGGQVKLDSVMDFGPEPGRLQFTLDAKNLDTKQVPPNWGLADRLSQGRLDGHGTVTLLVGGGKVTPGDSKGKVVIKGKLGGGDAELELFPEWKGGRIEFSGAPAARRPDPIAALVAVLLQPPPAAPPAPKKADAPQYVRANLKLRDVDLAELLKQGKIETSVKLAAKVTLEVAAEIPINDTGSVRLYRATGKVSAPSLQIEGLTLTQVTANLVLRDGVLALDRLSAAFPPGPDGQPAGFLGTARIGVDPRSELSADLKLNNIPLGQVFAAVPGLAGKASGTLSGAFDLKIPGDKLGDLAGYVANGNLTSTSLTVYGQKADKLAVVLVVRDGFATLTKLDADIYQGHVSGAAKLALTGNAAGDFRINFKDVDAGALTGAIPDTPVKLAGKVSGKLDGTLPPVQNFDATKVGGNLDLDAPQLLVNGVATTTKLKGQIGYKPGAIVYDLKGGIFGGTFDVNGAYPLGTAPPKDAPAAPAKDAPKKDAPKDRGTVRLTGLQLDRLASELKLASLKPLRGVVNLNLDYTLDAAGRPTGTGRVEVRGLAWGADATPSTLTSPIRLGPDGIDIPSLSGQFAGGSVRGRVEYPFAAGGRRSVVLSLDNADAATLLAPFGVTAAQGRVSVVARSRIGREVRGGGTIVASRTRVGGVDVSELRIPVTWAFVPGAGGEVTIRDAAGTVAGGRVTGRTAVVYRDTARVDGRVEFVGVNVGALAAASGSSGYGIGRTTGRFDFGGGAVRSVNDLNGTLTAAFGDTSVRELPILGSLGPLLAPAQALTRFDRGDLVARLGGGSVRVERLALNSKSAKLFADGTVGLNGRLDLDVVYTTGQVGPNAPLLRLVGRNIPAIGPIPVGLIIRVTEAVSNRVVRLRVGGTVANPAYSVDAARLLSENAVRFFVGQYVTDAIPIGQ